MMRKLYFILFIFLLSVSLKAQEGEKSAMLKALYETDTERFGIGLEGRYFYTDHVRFAPDIVFYLPNYNCYGLDFNANVHYVFFIQGDASVYPVAGFHLSNNRVTGVKVSSPDGTIIKQNGFGYTNIGFNLGFGGTYDVNVNNYINAEFRYTFTKNDYANIMIGYGIRF